MSVALDTDHQQRNNTTLFVDSNESPVGRVLTQLLQQGAWQPRTDTGHYFADCQVKSLAADLEDLSQEVCATQDPIDPIEVFSCAASFLTREQIEAAVKHKAENFEDAFLTAKEILPQAKYYLDKTENNDIPPTISSHMDKVVHALDAIIETLIDAFALSDVFKHPENEMQASFRFQKMMMLSSFLPAITAVLAPFIGFSVSSALITLACLFALAGLSVAYGKYMRPVTNELPYAQNWTQMAQEDRFVNIEERKQYSDRIELALGISKCVKAHPILVGPKGVGKSKIVKGFTHAVARGDYPKLKRKKIFYFDAKALVDAASSSSGYQKIFRSISAIMGRHREDIILVFDGLHHGSKKKDAGFFESFQPFLEDGKGSFPHVIGIAGDEEFSEVCTASPSFAHRFREIKVECADAAETVELLNSYLLKLAPHMLVQPGAMQVIFRKTTEAFKDLQPHISLDVLLLCLQKAAASQLPAEQAILTNQSALRAAVSDCTVQFQTADQGVQEAASKLEASKNQLQEETQKFSRLFSIRKRHHAVKTSIFRTAHKVQQMQGVANLFQDREAEVKKLLLLNHFLEPLLRKTVADKGAEIGVSTTINTDLIDSVIKEESERRKKVSS